MEIDAILSNKRISYRYECKGGILYKICRDCLQIKTINDFTNDKYTFDKKTNNCTECRNAKPQDNVRKRELYAKNYAKKKAEYFQKHKSRICKQRLGFIKRNPQALLIARARKQIRKHRLLNGLSKKTSSLKYLGCTKDFLYEYLKNKFKETYKIEFKHEYLKDLHIDHIVPASTIEREEDFAKICHYTNLRFLHKKHNMERKTNMNYTVPTYPVEDL